MAQFTSLMTELQITEHSSVHLHIRLVQEQDNFQIGLTPLVMLFYTFLAHLVCQPKSLYNHALSVIVEVSVTVGVGIHIGVIVRVQFSQPHG